MRGCFSLGASRRNANITRKREVQRASGKRDCKGTLQGALQGALLKYLWVSPPNIITYSSVFPLVLLLSVFSRKEKVFACSVCKPRKLRQTKKTKQNEASPAKTFWFLLPRGGSMGTFIHSFLQTFFERCVGTTFLAQLF